MPSSEIDGLLKTADGQRLFLEWRQSPVTRALVAELRRRATAQSVESVSGVSFAEMCIAQHWLDLGRADALRMVENFGLAPAVQELPKPDYGAKKYLQEWRLPDASK